MGIDGVDYSSVLAIDNDELCLLFNECIDRCEVPSAWLITAIVDVPKQ